MIIFAELAVLSTDDNRPSDNSVGRYQCTHRQHAASYRCKLSSGTRTDTSIHTQSHGHAESEEPRGGLVGADAEVHTAVPSTPRHQNPRLGGSYKVSKVRSPTMCLPRPDKSMAAFLKILVRSLGGTTT